MRHVLAESLDVRLKAKLKSFLGYAISLIGHSGVTIPDLHHLHHVVIT
ncbi:MAG: hypothetical protein VKK42_29280 [Lyngbya sp.]|nr:hypothetical protein [Lyngbya sp.]